MILQGQPNENEILRFRRERHEGMSNALHAFGGNNLARDADDAEAIAAALLLKEVRALLLQGQPRHAIAHICDTTGVDRAQASEFIAELQANVFG